MIFSTMIFLIVLGYIGTIFYYLWQLNKYPTSNYGQTTKWTYSDSDNKLVFIYDEPYCGLVNYRIEKYNKNGDLFEELYADKKVTFSLYCSARCELQSENYLSEEYFHELKEICNKKNK